MIGGTLYELGFSSGDLGGAVAEAILHDIRINGLGLAGFPQVFITRPDKNVFSVRLSFENCRESFEISPIDAKEAVRLMKESKGHSPAIFDNVQNALASLEGASS